MRWARWDRTGYATRRDAAGGMGGHCSKHIYLFTIHACITFTVCPESRPPCKRRNSCRVSDKSCQRRSSCRVSAEVHTLVAMTTRSLRVRKHSILEQRAQLRMLVRAVEDLVSELQLTTTPEVSHDHAPPAAKSCAPHSAQRHARPPSRLHTLALPAATALWHV
jgi:hypothetical protein